MSLQVQSSATEKDEEMSVESEADGKSNEGF